MNIYLIEECIYFMEDYEILQENVFHNIQNKLFSLSINDIKNKISDHKKKADDKLQRKGFSKKFIDSFTKKIAKDVKNKIKIDSVKDINKKNINKFYNLLQYKIKKELQNDINLKYRFGEGKFILSVIVLFIISISGTLAFMTSFSGFLVLPFFWFLMSFIYHILVSKYIDEYYD